MLKLPDLLVGTAARHGAVTVLPLFPSVPRPGVAYRLGAHALASGALEIAELRSGATVDRVEAKNRSPDRVLLIEGDHLLGSKQNRVVTSSVLLGARGDATLPVSCVEQGRWQSAPGASGASASFRRASTIAPSSVRRIIKQSVTASLLDGSPHLRRADQSQIWSHIQDQQRHLRVTSATHALEASYLSCVPDLRSATSHLPYAPAATGLAIGLGGHLISIDLFDQPATCEFYWRQLVEGATLEALGLSPAAASSSSIGSHEVESLIAQLLSAAWRAVPPVGEGQELRARTSSSAASALVVDGQVIHFGAATAAPTGLESSPRPMRRELPPELADRYRITARLGVGGVKEVFRATDLRGGPDVAIARLPYVRREIVEREADISRRVQSPYVPRIYESFIDAAEDGYIVMELCEGPTLAQLAHRPLTLAEAGPILVELARGLRAVHAARVLHRDVKPENVLLCRTERGIQLKLVDFGLSAPAAAETTAVAQLGFSGTLPYMAREVLRGTDVDARSDVFAFGVCCYRVLVGQVPLPPHRSESDFDYIVRLSDIDHHELTKLPPLPAPAGELLARILTGERERRPYMPEVVAAFERAFGTGPIVLPADPTPQQQAAASSPTVAASSPVAVPSPATRSASSRLRLERTCFFPIPVAAPEHLLVAPCERTPMIALSLEPQTTLVRGLAADGAIRWTQRIRAPLLAGLRADLDLDGEREAYLAGPGRLVAITRDGGVRYKRRLATAALPPVLAALPDRAAPALYLDGQALDPRTGHPLDLDRELRVYEGDGQQLVEVSDARGASYNGVAQQAFRGVHRTPAAILAHPGQSRFLVAHLEEDAHTPGLQVLVYGPGGARVHALRVQDYPASRDFSSYDLETSSAVFPLSPPRWARRLGPEHAPLGVLGPDGTAALIVPLVGVDGSGESSISAYSLPEGRELWRWTDRGLRGRAMLGDLDGDGRPELVVGTGHTIYAFDPWTGDVRMEMPGPGMPVAIGDPFGSGAAHLILASDQGIEVWRGRGCRRSTMSWTGMRGDLWRSGTVDVYGAPIGPL